MTHGIQSLVKADQMQVQMVIALHNARSQTVAYNPAHSCSGSCGAREGDELRHGEHERARRTAESRSSMETTLRFVIPRFNPKGTQLSLQVRQRSVRESTSTWGLCARAARAAKVSH